MTAAPVRVTCCQLAPQLGDLEHNQQLSVAAIAGAVAAGADVVVLPELVTSGYCFESPEQARSVAIGRDHALFSRWAEVSSGAVVVGGFAELGEDGLLYNSAAVVADGAVVAVYRKTHLWDTEKLFFTPGDTRPPVIATRFGSLGVLICYDLEFPEMTRSLAMNGAELVAVPTNWPLLEVPPTGEHAGEVVIAMAAARVNRVFIACCDRTGIERGQSWTEGTTILSPSGWPLAAAGPDGVATADLDLAAARDKTVSARNDVLADRRPEIYAVGDYRRALSTRP